MSGTSADTRETVMIVNPRSGSADHAPLVHDRAALRGYRVEETERAGHAVQLAQRAAESGATEIVAVGGDGTLNEVVKGLQAAGALGEVTVGVVPAGTGNDFATNIGITDIEQAFDVLDSGPRRVIDLGMADGDPFLNSCIAGITAKASNETSSELKSRLGVFAYVATTLRLASSFSGIELSASLVEGENSKSVWEGTAAVVLVGNGRRFSMAGTDQANLEDGLLDVTIIEDAASFDLAVDRLGERLFGNEGDNLERVLASSLELSVTSDESTAFSLDGEILELDSVELASQHEALCMYVGEGYERTPQTGSSSPS
jgi:diacylglycerol kinase (ATP)